MIRPTPEVRKLDLQVQIEKGWSPELYLDEAMIEAEKLN